MLTRLRTYRRLGLQSLARVAAYRALLKAGVHPAQRIAAPRPVPGPFFGSPRRAVTLPAPSFWEHETNYFGWIRRPLHDAPPDWLASLETGARARGGAWWTIPDFDPAVGDVKAIWEASRMDWAIAMAQRAATGHAPSLDRLNAWLADWHARNPAYTGPNWKCGQETSIRILHLAVAALVLDQVDEPTEALRATLAAHARRVAPTMSYAIGQDNNHGTSEAAALLVAGTWLARWNGAEAAGWARIGRRTLEERVGKLVAADGSFSQHSVNYHRLLLDTLSLAEVWRRRMEAPEFSDGYRSRAAAAARWLQAMVDAETGLVPNYGHNDGANLLPLTEADVRDFRPSAELGMALFADTLAFSTGLCWPAHLAWLGVAAPTRAAASARSAVFPDGGTATLHREKAMAFFRYPRFRYRPSHADALHVDLRVNGLVHLRDGGTYSYASEWLDYFAGVRSHNTVQFDDHDQMPRLGRFLWGDWISVDGPVAVVEGDGGTAVSATYRDRFGCRHARTVELRDDLLRVTDHLSGFRDSAVLRWRLRPGAWTLDGTTARGEGARLAITSSLGVKLTLQEGWESTRYLERAPIPVLEARVTTPGEIITEYRWNA